MFCFGGLEDKGGQRMRLNQLEYFLKVVECGSITKAAQELYLTQPSLTKAISSLEAEYNMKLFNRTSKGLSLTLEGRDFLEYAKNVIESSRALEKTFGKKDNPLVQRLAIASQQFDFIYDVLLLLYQENNGPLLQIDLKENDRGEIVEMVEECKADIGILVLSEKDSKIFKSEIQSKNLEMHVLDHSSVYICMGKKSKLYDRQSIEVKEAEKYLHVVLDTEQTFRREILYKADCLDGYGHEHLIFCNTIGVCKKFLEETEALLMAHKWVLGVFQGTEIHCVPLYMDGQPYPEVNHLVWIKRANEPFHPLEERFMELLEAHFSD